MSKHTPTPWKWHPKSIEGEHNGSVYSEQRKGHAYAIAMMPAYQTDEKWSDDAAFIVKAVNSHDALVSALEGLLKANDDVQTALCDGPEVPGFDRRVLADAQRRVDEAETVARAALATTKTGEME